jgi:hypothetical protein
VRPELKPLLWAGAATLAAVLLVAFLRPRTDPQAAPAAGAVVAEPAIPAAAPEHRASDSEAGPLPWQRSSAADGVSAGASAHARPGPGGAMDRAQFMAAMQVQLQRNQAAADAALQRIAEVQASGQAPEGVDLDALRDNLQIAKQAQALAMELARIGGEADTPERAQKIAAITPQLLALQSRLQHDMASRPGAYAAPASQIR